jgi:methyl-accepting chemotaxis protein
MGKHQGTLVETAIKNSGVAITRIIKKIKSDYKGIRCSRTKLYSLFKQKEIDPKLILVLGSIIYYDFTKDFVGLKDKIVDFALEEGDLSYYKQEKYKDELLLLKKEFSQLQKSYNRVINFLNKLVNSDIKPVTKKEIERFLK